jgi:hypothetical protein
MFPKENAKVPQGYEEHGYRGSFAYAQCYILYNSLGCK